MPQLWVVAGPNGAGKTTLVSRRLADRITVVNPDAIAVDEGFDERQAGTVAIKRRRDLLARRADFAIETTLAGASALRFMQIAKGEGYKVSLVYVGLRAVGLSIHG